MINIPADIDVIARMSYERGQDPVEFAEACIVQNHLRVYLSIIIGRAENPAAFPGYLLELTPDALARRIIGGLLDAGWTSPAEGWAGPAYSADDLTDISESARVAYLCGVSPVGYAEHVVAGAFESHLRLVQEFTGCGPEVALRVTGEMSLANVAHCLVSLLLNAGWTAPEVTR